MTTNTQVQYRVGSKGGVCIGPRSTYFGPNVVIPSTLLDEKTIARLLKDRAIVRVGEVQPVVKDPAPPAVGIGTRAFDNDRNESVGEVPAQAGGDGAAAQARAQLAQIEAERAAGTVKPVEAATSVEIVREEKPEAPAATTGYTHDPDGLLGMPADDLRKLVLDIDPTMEVNHLDEVELIAVLSSEYVAPAQA